MSHCPSADLLVGFVGGELTPEASASVESHIDSCTDCRRAVSNAVRAEVRAATFGRYRIDTVLGSGGMGIVYRAWDPKLRRAVAIKVLRQAGNDPAQRARLVREAQSLAQLSHAHVCHVYDVGTEGDEIWVAMELVEGVTLRQWAGVGAPRDRLLDVLLGCAEGLATAHAVGIVHRDVKPENVLVTREGRAVVTDFGLARVDLPVDGSSPTLSKQLDLTATGAIAGTPAYLAPEQLTGGAIDARVDQFAWAVMAWELLTGTRPFPSALSVRLEAIRAGVTAPPELPPEIGRALSRALAVTPHERFASMRELITVMRRSRSTLVRPKRRRALVVVALATLVVTGVFRAWQLLTTPTTDFPAPAPLPLESRSAATPLRALPTVLPSASAATLASDRVVQAPSATPSALPVPGSTSGNSSRGGTSVGPARPPGEALAQGAPCQRSFQCRSGLCVAERCQ